MQCDEMYQFDDGVWMMKRFVCVMEDEEMCQFDGDGDFIVHCTVVYSVWWLRCIVFSPVETFTVCGGCVPQMKTQGRSWENG